MPLELVFMDLLETAAFHVTLLLKYQVQKPPALMVAVVFKFVLYKCHVLRRVGYDARTSVRELL